MRTSLSLNFIFFPLKQQQILKYKEASYLYAPMVKVFSLWILFCFKA